MISIEQRHKRGNTDWAVMRCVCNIEDPDDAFVSHIVDYVRKAYGEDSIIEISHDPSIEAQFDIDNLIKGIRSGMPDPSSERGKPQNLTHYRSGTAELLAKRALTEAYEVLFPIHGQIAQFNPNQPLLGFDGWGFIKKEESEDGFQLVLVEVKGSDQDKSPPDAADDLAEECLKASTTASTAKISALLRFFMLIAQNTLKNNDLRIFAIYALQKLGEGKTPNIVVAPVIVRGKIRSRLSDLDPVIDAVTSIEPVGGAGATISVGVELGYFGQTVMTKARGD